MKHLTQLNITTQGLEGSLTARNLLLVPQSLVTTHDLRTPYTTTKKFDVAVSIEVAEHIEPEHADTYLNTLTKLSDTIYLTAAPPGQAGTGHFNCQPQEYWKQKLSSKGYSYCPTITEQLKQQQKISTMKNGSYLHKNLMVFKRGDAECAES